MVCGQIKNQQWLFYAICQILIVVNGQILKIILPTGHNGYCVLFAAIESNLNFILVLVTTWDKDVSDLENAAVAVLQTVPVGFLDRRVVGSNLIS